MSDDMEAVDDDEKEEDSVDDDDDDDVMADCGKSRLGNDAVVVPAADDKEDTDKDDEGDEGEAALTLAPALAVAFVTVAVGLLGLAASSDPVVEYDSESTLRRVCTRASVS